MHVWLILFVFLMDTESECARFTGSAISTGSAGYSLTLEESRSSRSQAVL